MTLYNSHTDKQLLSLLQNSDEAAFTEIYNRYWDKLFSVAYHRIHDELEAEEIVQDIFVSLWNRREAIQLVHSLNTYLSVAVKYQVITRLAQARRKRKYEEQLRLSADETVETTMNWLNEKELKRQIAQCVTSLPEKCRLVFLMSREQHLSNADIAQELQVAEKTVEGHITKALQVLRTALKLVLLLVLCVFQ